MITTPKGVYNIDKMNPVAAFLAMADRAPQEEDLMEVATLADKIDSNVVFSPSQERFIVSLFFAKQ